MPNFVLLDTNLPDLARLFTAMLQAREAVDRRSWSHPQEPASDDWWADVLADPRARRRRRIDMALRRESYRLSDERHEMVLVACSKCDWRAGYPREKLVSAYGADFPMPSLLSKLAKPGCVRLGNQWDACGVYLRPADRREVTGSRHDSRRSRAVCLLLRLGLRGLAIASSSSIPLLNLLTRV